MQELHLLIKERFQKVKELIKKQTSSETYQALKEQQKVRCEKESWILSMLRSKKSLNIQNKINFYSNSYKIMKIIDSQFQHEQANVTDQTFLNDFVCLYTTFFDRFQSKFSFKLKIKNLLRPTNHYIVIDLIKYLADFSRDYYQQIFFWHLKIIKKIEEQQDQQKNNCQKMNVFPEKPLQGYRNSLYIKRTPDQSEVQNGGKRLDFQKLYQMLDLQPFSQFVMSEKNKSNMDAIKLRMNQMYRDSKYRNNIVKTSLQDYYNNYFPNFQPKPYLVQDSSSNISYPFKVTLNVEKNGFSCLNLNINEQRIGRQERSLSPLKEKKFSSFSTQKDVINPQKLNQFQQQVNKKQIMLNSLKVLRVSQNFLPPLLQGVHQTKIVQKKEKHDKKRTSFSKTENVIKQISEEQKEFYKDGLRYYNEELSNESEKLLKQKKKIKDLRHQFTSQEKLKRTKKMLNDPEDKILEWLGRINTMKQIERKKILGLN